MLAIAKSTPIWTHLMQKSNVAIVTATSLWQKHFPSRIIFPIEYNQRWVSIIPYSSILSFMYVLRAVCTHDSHEIRKKGLLNMNEKTLFFSTLNKWVNKGSLFYAEEKICSKYRVFNIHTAKIQFFKFWNCLEWFVFLIISVN